MGPSKQGEVPGGAEGPAGGGARGRLIWIVPALLALAPALGTLAAPWISEDASILGYVHREGLAPDWTGSQFGLSTVRFWRPLTTTSWALQEWWVGPSPAGLRSLNLGLHAACAALAALLVRRLGGGVAAAGVAGALVALYPDQGGTVTWLAGRTDLLAVAGMLTAVVLALVGRGLLAGLAAFLACASKEVAFVVPAWAFLFAWGAGGTPARAARSAAPVVAGTLVALALRAAAIGSLIGGYPRAEAFGVASLGPGLATWASCSLPLLLAVAASLTLGALAGRPRVRMAAAALMASLLASLPALALTGDGVLEETNRRVLLASDLALCVAFGVAVGTVLTGPTWRSGRSPAVLGAFLIALALLGLRGRAAFRDTREWGEAARSSAEEIARVRAALDLLGRSSEPALVAGLPRSAGGAYALAFGVADRFRPPFPPGPRPVWPLRTIFAAPSSERPMPLPEREGLFLPRAVAEPPGSPLLLKSPEESPPGVLRVDERVARDPDRSPLLLASGTPAGADALEVVLFTEVGYEPVPFGAPGSETSLRELAGRFNGRVTLGEALIQAADLGATRAYLELRALRAGRPVAFSPWLELRWEPDLLERTREGVSAP